MQKKSHRGPKGPRPAAPKAKSPAKADTSSSLYIEKFTEDGLGLGSLAGKEALAFGAYPGEKVLVAVEHEGQRRIVARLLKVLERSPHRVPPSCLVSRRCQGCPLIELAYPKQLEAKRQKVLESLRAYPSLGAVQIAPTLEALQSIGYRTNAKLALAKSRGQVRIGIFRRGTHEVTDIGGCPLHHPLINRIVEVVRDEIDRQKISIFDPRHGRGLLRYLVIKVSPDLNKAMVTFVTTEREYRQITHLAKWLKSRVPEVVSIHQNLNRSEGNVILGRETLKMLGAPDLFDQVGDIRLRISPTSFFQVNHDQARRIYEQVRAWAALTPEDTALDLYCGIGGIALNLARDAGSVVGIEVVEEATRNAAQNARENGLTNCRFVSGDAAELMAEIRSEIPSLAVAVVNPPRKGCDPEVLEALCAMAPRTLIYVSCNPASLARDLDLLCKKDYVLREVQPVDMFPQTFHVETLVRLERRAPQEAKP